MLSPGGGRSAFTVAIRDMVPTLLYTIIQHYTLLYSIIHYYTALYTIIQHYTVLYSIIQYTGREKEKKTAKQTGRESPDPGMSAILLQCCRAILRRPFCSTILSRRSAAVCYSAL